MPTYQDIIKRFISNEQNLIKAYEAYRGLWKVLAFDQEFTDSLIEEVDTFLEKRDGAIVQFRAEDFASYLAIAALLEYRKEHEK